MNIFSSVEFYTIAITVAILLVGFIFNPKKESQAISYLFSGNAYPSDDTGNGSLRFEALDDGSLLVTRTGITIPLGCIVSAQVDVVDDKIAIVEKVSCDDSFSKALEQCDIVFKIDCLRAKRYHVRYESPQSGQWAVTSIANHSNYISCVDMQY